MKASVIIPAYNEEKTIGNTLESLREQSFRDFEIIVVNDGSRDRTAEIAKKAGAKVITQKNAGPAAARNNGARAAKGEFVVFIDADCVADERWLEHMLKPFSDKEVAGVQGAYKSNQKSLVARFTQLDIEDRYKRLDRKADQLDWIGSYSAAYRKNIFIDLGGFDEDFPNASGEDPELSFKVSREGYKLVFKRNAIVYHFHETSLLKYLRTKFYRAYWRVLLYSKHTRKIVTDSYTPQMLKVQILFLYASAFFSILTVVGINMPVFVYGVDLSLTQKRMFLSTVISAGSFILTTLPFTVESMKKDLVASILSPIFIFFRTFSFSLGLIYGVVRGKWLAPLIKKVLNK
jgi:glycosyltransferase involved in cell wall biosynthesis